MPDLQPDSVRPVHRPGGGPSGAGVAAASAGAALLVIVCCVGPALLAVGALGALGGFLSNAGVITAAVATAAVLAGAAITVLVRSRCRDDACSPPQLRADQEGPHR